MTFFSISQKKYTGQQRSCTHSHPHTRHRPFLHHERLLPTLLTFVKGSAECRMVTEVQQKTTGNSEAASLPWVLEEAQGMCWGHKGSGWGVAERVMGPGARASMRVTVGGPWGSQVKARLVNSNQNDCGFGEHRRVLSTGHARGRPWETGEPADHRLAGEVRSGTHICL